MFKSIFRLHNLSLIIGLIFIVFFLILGKQDLVINVHDTYFVIAFFHLGLLIFFIHCLFAFIYYLIYNYYKFFLGLIHLCLVLPLYIIILLTPYLHFGEIPRRYYSNRDPDFISFSFIDDPRMLVFEIFIFAQLFLISNIIFSVIKFSKQKNKK